MDTISTHGGETAVTGQGAIATPQVVTPPPVVARVGKARVAVSFLSQESDANLIVSIQSIVTGMAGNAAYPTPNPPLAEITTARNGFIASVNAAKDSRRQIVVRRQQRAALVALVRTLAHYVQVASGGDLPTLMSSGFIAQRTGMPVGALPAPTNLRMTRGKISGQLNARCNKLPQAGSYEWRYASIAAPTTWVALDATFGARATIDGLVPGTSYIVQVRALGTAGPSNWSGAAMLMVV